MSLKKTSTLLSPPILTREDEKSGWLLTAGFVLLVVIAAVIIVYFTKPVIYDQVIVNYRFQKGYPNISSGIVSHLLIGSYNFVVNPAGAAQNVHIKLLAMMLFMVSAFLLARSIFKNRLLTALFLVMLFASRYPFLWLSTELIVASLLFLALWSMVKRFHPALAALFLALLCFSKPEMALIAIVLLVYYGFRLRKTSRAIVILVAGFVVFSLLILAPGIVKQGSGYFSGANRSMFSFGQHYAALFHRHQIAPDAPDPWDDYHKYLEANFKGAKSIIDVITRHPLKYFDYVLLSFGHGMLKAAALLHILLFLLGWMIYRYFRDKTKPVFAERLIFFSFIGYMPLFMLSYPHIRYLARYYPLVLILVLMFLKRLAVDRDTGDTEPKPVLVIAIGVFILAVIINLILLAHNLAGFESVKEFWFPD